MDTPPAAWLPPIQRRALIIFAALVVLLLVPWPGWGRTFATGFSVYGNGLVAVAGGWNGPPPRFEVPARGAIAARDGGPWAVVLAGEHPMPLDTRILAYTPFAIFFALALATPVPPRRRLIILAAGLACLLARLAFAVLVPLARAFGGGRSDSTLAWLADVGWTVFVSPPVMSYATPLAVWLLGVALTTPRPARAPSRRAARSRGRKLARRKRDD
jgi:hypothetical protein